MYAPHAEEGDAEKRWEPTGGGRRDRGGVGMALAGGSRAGARGAVRVTCGADGLVLLSRQVGIPGRVRGVVPEEPSTRAEGRNQSGPHDKRAHVRPDVSR